MSATKHSERRTPLPKRFDELVALMPPRAIADDVALDNMIEMVDRLMVSGRLTKGQADYMETLVQLVQVYEAEHYPIQPVSGLELLHHLLEENGMSASDLARILGVHASMGSKILKGERSLTIEHVKKLAARFHLRADAFID